MKISINTFNTENVIHMRDFTNELKLKINISYKKIKEEAFK